MKPIQAIAMLDRQLARHGQTVTLKRGTTSVTVKGFVRGYKPDELTGGIQQGDSAIVLSPTSLASTEFATTLPRRLDKIVTAGRERTIQQADPVLIADVVVRINLQVRG